MSDGAKDARPFRQTRLGSIARRRRRPSGTANGYAFSHWKPNSSSTTTVGLEPILWRYEIGYRACRYKILGDITSLRDSTTVFLFGLKSLYFGTDDAEQAFIIRIKDSGSRISGRRNVANCRPILGCQITGKQRW